MAAGAGLSPSSAGPSGSLGFRRERHAEQPRGAGVVVDREHQLAGRLVDARTPADHLVEGDRALHVAEKRDVPHAGHVHARRQQLHRGRDEVRRG